jgi:hypothetical protein
LLSTVLLHFLNSNLDHPVRNAVNRDSVGLPKLGRMLLKSRATGSTGPWVI